MLSGLAHCWRVLHNLTLKYISNFLIFVTVCVSVFLTVSVTVFENVFGSCSCIVSWSARRGLLGPGGPWGRFKVSLTKK